MLPKPSKIGKKSRVSRTAISCDRCKARKTKCNKPDANGPCDYCRSIDEVCSIDIAKRRQKPFYFVSEEEYRLLRELCSRCYPDVELTLETLRQLVSDEPVVSTVQGDAFITNGIAASSHGSENIETTTKSPAALPPEEEGFALPEIVSLHNDLGCLLPDAHGEYRYIGAESGVSFNGAVKSWILRMGAQAKNAAQDKDKIPPLVKVSPPSTKSPFTSSSSPGRQADSLPPQDLLTSCAARFFEQVHCIYWLYSSEDFYTRLETTYSSGDTRSHSASWLCSLQGLIALCACGEESCDAGTSGPESLESAKALVSRVCEEAGLDSIRALIILTLALQSNGLSTLAYVHLGLAVRIAFSLGLHLDKYSSQGSVVGRAYARRLWWTLFLFDQDLSLQLGKPSMAIPIAADTWQPPLPSECVVTPGSHTPHGYLEQAIKLAHLAQGIRQRLYSGPIHYGQRLTQRCFSDATESLNEWLKGMPPHLHLSTSMSPLHRRSISILYLRYWSTVMLVTKPFLLCNLLRGDEIEAQKQPIFAEFARTCLSAAEASFDILESMVSHNVMSSLLVTDFFFSLQTLQVTLAACGLYQGEVYRDRAKRCLRILLATSVSGYAKYLLPETLFQLQQCGIVEGAEEDSLPIQPIETYPSMQRDTQRLNRDSRDHLSTSWLGDSSMADVIIDEEFWENVMDFSEIFPPENYPQTEPIM